jgi:hypothetical protein
VLLNNSRALAACGLLFLAGPGRAQLIRTPAVTAAQLPDPGSTGRLRAVTDGASATDCSTGLGSHKVLCMDDGDSWVWVGAGAGGAQSLFETFSVPSGTNPVADSAMDTLTLTASAPLTITGDATSDTLAFAVSAASTGFAGACELATSAESTVGLCVQASDTRLTDARTPAGAAGGVLSGNYPDPSLASDAVVLGTNTSGGFAGSASEGGPATSALAATALAANGTDCDSGQAARGVDASGNSEGCFSPTVAPPGATTQIPFNDAGEFGADTDLTWDKTANMLILGNGSGSARFNVWYRPNGGGGITLDNNQNLNGVGLVIGSGLQMSGANARISDGEILAGANFRMSFTSGNWDSSSRDAGFRRSGPGVITIDNGSSSGAGALRLPPMSSPPVSCGSAGTAGVEYFDTDSSTFCGCNGTAWISMGGPGPCS